MPEAAMGAKRADYFETGTEIVRDVDPISEEVRVYRAGQPDLPEVLRRGQEVGAEPAVDGWFVSVGWISS